MTRLPRIVREIHRRSVWQVLGIYVVASWVVLQVVETLSSLLTLPEWFPSFAVALLLLGLPIVLATAFVQGAGDGGSHAPDAMSAGEPGGRRADATEPTLRGLLTWRNALLGGAGAFAVWGVVTAGWLVLGPGPTVGGENAVEAEERSLAVLPFRNLSDDEEAAPFVNGVHEDLLTRLSKIGALRIISRTSMQRYRDTDLSLPEIAGELGVAWILEGGVQRAGDRVRVNVQLIRASADEHAWADTYDRQLTVENTFEIQADVARRIAGALEAELSPEEERRMALGATGSLEAYDLYQRGRFALNSRGPDGVRRAIRQFELAIEQDPSYALAHAGLADALSLGWFYGYALGESPLERALAITRRAVDLEPELAEAHASLGFVLLNLADVEGSETAFLRAIGLNFGYAQANHWYSITLRVMNRTEEAWDRIRRGLELDPLSPAAHTTASSIALALEGPRGALRECRMAVELEPEYGLGRLCFGLQLALSGEDPEAGVREIDQARTDLGQAGDSIFGGLPYLAAAHAVAGRPDSARVLLAATRRSDPFFVGLAYALLGDTAAALDHLGRSRWTHRFPVMYYIHDHPMLDSLRGNPRFEVLVAEAERAWGLR